MSESDPQLLRLFRDVTLTVKCLKCKDSYEFEGLTITADLVVDPDTGEFVQYDVEFAHVDESPVYLQDQLCLPNHCSVFGRLPNGHVFAFPWLVPDRRSDTWHSKPDKRGDHFAMKRPKRVGL
jgi:hypothetical protein